MRKMVETPADTTGSESARAQRPETLELQKKSRSGEFTIVASDDDVQLGETLLADDRVNNLLKAATSRRRANACGVRGQSDCHAVAMQDDSKMAGI